MSKRTHVIPLLLVLCLALASCTAKTTAKTEVGDLPDMVMRNARYTVGSGSQTPLVIDAQSITIYSGTNARTLLEKLSFSREPSISGHCDSASVTDGDKIVTMTGNVMFSSADDKVEILCDGLVWNQETGTLTTTGEVTVSYGDGTTIRAVGLTATPDKDVYEFERILEGSLEIE